MKTTLIVLFTVAAIWASMTHCNYYDGKWPVVTCFTFLLLPSHGD